MYYVSLWEVQGFQLVLCSEVVLFSENDPLRMHVTSGKHYRVELTSAP